MYARYVAQFAAKNAQGQPLFWTGSIKTHGAS